MMAVAASAESDLSGDVFGEGPVPGPVPAIVLRIIDGDTIRVRAHIWLGQEVVTNVRLRGVDTAEMHARCDAERRLAEQARVFVEDKLTEDHIVLRDITYDKYGRRVVASVMTASGEDLSQALLAAGLAHPYQGGHKMPWCPTEEAPPE